MPETIIINMLIDIRNVLYFLTGGWLFFMITTSLPSQKLMNSNTETVLSIFCYFVVWCWLFSKLITL